MELIDLIGTIGLGNYKSKSKDILGRVYEYFFFKKASLPVPKEKKGDRSTRQRVLLKFLSSRKGRHYDSDFSWCLFVMFAGFFLRFLESFVIARFNELTQRLFPGL